MPRRRNVHRRPDRLAGSAYGVFSGLAFGGKFGALFGLTAGTLAGVFLVLISAYAGCCGVIFAVVCIPFLMLFGCVAGAAWGAVCSSLGAAVGSLIPRKEIALATAALIGAAPGTALIVYIVAEWPFNQLLPPGSVPNPDGLTILIAAAAGLALTGIVGAVTGAVVGRSVGPD